MTEKSLSEKVLSIIKEKKIKPRPRWQFLLKNYVIWGAGVLSLLIGGAAFSVIIYLLRYNDWSIYNQITGSLSEFILLTLPYFWILFLAFFIFVVNYDIKHTKRGYRYPLPIIAVVSIVISIILGGLFFRVGLGHAIDDVLGKKAPLYSKIFNRGMHLWFQPEEGRLAGMVIEKTSDAEFMILDLNQHEWNIIAEQAKIMPRAEIQAGRPVRLMGEKISEDIFRADGIMPVGPGRGFFMRHKGTRSFGPGNHQKMPKHLKNNSEFKGLNKN